MRFCQSGCVADCELSFAPTAMMLSCPREFAALLAQLSCHSIWWYSEKSLDWRPITHCNRRPQACTYLTRGEPPFDLRLGRALTRGVDSRYQNRLFADFRPSVFGRRHNPGLRRRQIFRSPLTCKALELSGSVQA